jgi:hypothetical protein
MAGAEPDPRRALLLQLLHTALGAVDGRRRVRAALPAAAGAGALHALAVGKAAAAMMQGAVDALGPRLARGTSEMRNPWISQPRNAAARRPPLRADIPRRLAFSRSMSQPSVNDRAVSARRSASVTPAAGTSASAEAPPETSNSTCDPAGVAVANSSLASPAARLRSSGSG